eukprot:CAMPEP_0183357400 /NCGR_PEP_ID=MMETSP0164_2-20130417/46166_1 /TAXON_ID=221442 /ORGANISM="Coccolithus pelagicus ssp braarudi, Strain PLY182g" /LENGTH=312 /DNA_ID=CAMNT_0025530999 /DNA_START=23 /DNA_END=958 /DNA_ORIENTATION=-
MAAVAMMPVMPVGPVHMTSSVGLLAMLEEPAQELKAHALEKLNAIVGDFWAEIAESLSDIEALYEDALFPHRQLAALVASKVYFYLGEMGDALQFALGAGALFRVDEGSEYVDTLLAKAIDNYCELHRKRTEPVAMADSEAAAEVTIDSRLSELVDRMVESSLAKRSYQLVLGLALESRRLELVERVITLCDASPGEHEHDSSTSAMLSYCSALFMTALVTRDFRKKLLALLVRVYRSQLRPDYFGMCSCLAQLTESVAVADILKSLVESGGKDELLVAFQVAFDMVENCTQSFLKALLQLLQPPAPPAPIA